MAFPNRKKLSLAFGAIALGVTPPASLGAQIAAPTDPSQIPSVRMGDVGVFIPVHNFRRGAGNTLHMTMYKNEVNKMAYLFANRVVYSPDARDPDKQCPHLKIPNDRVEKTKPAPGVYNVTLHLTDAEMQRVMDARCAVTKRPKIK